MAAAAVLWIAGRVVLARFLHARLARTALFGLAGLGVLAVVVVPAYLNETVVEAFPLTSAPAAAETIVPTPSSPPTTASTAPASTAPDMSPARRPLVHEVASAPTAAPSSTAPATPAPTTTIAPAEPVRLRSGQFMGVDHRACRHRVDLPWLLTAAMSSD